ncbi:hypothetical protein IFM46972_10771 [Aspergillus udagawae]|uniref:Uncharacterized protein n=1 Tax=Aspergillus udagawae TaxID=91492 RepID=A0A8H3SED5_9EURO|nr:hypothetical protein IFM46972_10771 [Aspergillus udagawae]
MMHQTSTFGNIPSMNLHRQGLLNALLTIPIY